MIDAIDLIGRHIDDWSVTTFLADHGGPHTVDALDEEPSVGRYVTSPKSGVELSLDRKGLVKVVFLHLNGHDEKPEFRGKLPLGLSNDLTQIDIRRRLGTPAFERAPTAHRVLGSYGPADRYDLVTSSVHLEYTESAHKLVLVTIMAASAVPDLPGEAGTTRH